MIACICDRNHMYMHAYVIIGICVQTACACDRLNVYPQSGILSADDMSDR